MLGKDKKVFLRAKKTSKNSFGKSAQKQGLGICVL